MYERWREFKKMVAMLQGGQVSPHPVASFGIVSALIPQPAGGKGAGGEWHALWR